MAVTVDFYNHVTEVIGDGALDMDGDTFKVALLNNSHAFNAANTVYADISANEIANGDGYTTGGATLANIVWAQTAGVGKFSADNPSWTASGAGITAYHAVIYSSTGNELICSVDFGGVVSAASGATLTIEIPASGIFSSQFV